jgi:hypothetical protein
MKPVTPQTEQTPSNQLRKVVFGGSLMNNRKISKTGFCLNLAASLVCLAAPVLMVAAEADKAAAAPKPGSAALPVTYEGPALPNRHAPDGGLRYSPGVQNFQIARANRKPAPFFDNGPGFTYQHHIDLGCWKGRLYAVWDMSPKDEDTRPCRFHPHLAGRP